MQSLAVNDHPSAVHGRPGAGTRTRRPHTGAFLMFAAAAALVTGLSGCGGSTTSNTSGGSSTTSSSGPATSPTSAPSPSPSHVAAQPTPGCAPSGSAAAGPTGTTTLHPVVDGVTRTVIVHAPAGYQPGTPVPLVLNLHGSQSTAAAQEAFSGMDATSDQDGFVVAYPQGGIAATTGFEWNVPGQPLFGGSAVPSNAPNDVAFLEQLTQTLGGQYCLDRRRVFATGFSGGARMSSQLGCDASTTFAAVAPVSGLRLPSPCAATRAVPVIAFHGTADPVDPYRGNGQAYWTYSVPVAAAKWAAQDGCSPAAHTSAPSAKVVVTTYGNCRAAVVVQLQTLVGEGHEWPGGPPVSPGIARVLGPQSNAVDANSTMWAFFSSHPLPAS